MSYRIKCLITTLLACSIVLPLSAKTVTSDPVIVTASRLDNESTSAPLQLTVITAEEIQKSTSRTLPELLSQQAGISSRSLYGNNAARATVDMRGFGATSTQNTLILLDGRRLNDVDLSHVDFAAIPLSNISRIEILRGSGSVLYGDGAVGGTINIITRQETATGATGRFAATLGSYDTAQLEAAVTHNEGMSSFSLAISDIRSDGYRQNNDLDQTNIATSAHLARENGELYFKLSTDKQELRLPGVRTVNPTAFLNELHNDRRGTNTPLDFAEQSGYALTTGITHFTDSEAEVIFDLGYRNKSQQAFLSGLFSSYVDTELNTWSITPRYKTGYNTFGYQSNAIIGLDYYDSDYDSDRAQSEASSGTPIHRLGIGQKNLALYGQNIAHLSEASQLIMGGRWQQVKLEARDIYDASAPGAGFDNEAVDLNTSDAEIMLELGINHQLDESTSLFANLNRNARFATVDEVFEFDPSFVRVFSPLAPQTANTIDLGISFTRADYDITANLYYMKLKNEIHFSPGTFTNDNLDPTKRYGIETSAGLNIIDDVHINASYTYTVAKFRRGIYAGNRIPLVSAHTASITTLWDISPEMLFTLTFNHVGEKFFDNDQENSFMRIPSYQMVDLKLARENGPWTFSGTINNLLGEKAYDYGVKSTFTPGVFNAYPLPERSVYVTASREL